MIYDIVRVSDSDVKADRFGTQNKVTTPHHTDIASNSVH